jgi:CheY-like chemotaxis protein
MLRVLIAEDDPDTWTPYKIVLEKRGHSVDIAEDGEQCIEKYMRALKDAVKKEKSDNYTDDVSERRTRSKISRDHTISPSRFDLPPFDAVVLDYRMPKKDGLEVAKDILAANPSQRIIFASAYVKETLKESVKELRQIVELMQKPFLPEALVDVVEDRESYHELKKLFVNVRSMTENDFADPTPDQIREIFEGLKKIQKGRTF